jgi:outer membrane protein insertion porin family
MKKYFIIFLFLSSTFQIAAQENYLVSKVTFEGNHTISRSQLLAKMNTKTTNGLQRLKKNGNVSAFSSALLQDDIQYLTKFYQREGFLDAVISINDLSKNDNKQRVKVTLSVNEGAPVIVDTLQFKIMDRYDQAPILSITDAVKKDLLLGLGKRFRDLDLQQDLSALYKEMVNNGFPHAEISHKLSVNIERHRVTVVFLIKSGAAAQFGGITFKGNENISNSLIKKQLAFQTGDVFKRNMLDASQQRIYSLNAFRIINVLATVENDSQTVIPIRVNVIELPRFTSKLGIGWGTEDQFRSSLDFGWGRFLGGARRLNIFLKHSKLEPYHAKIGLRQPAFLSPETGIGSTFFIRKQAEPAYKLERFGVQVYLQRYTKFNINWGLTYAFENVNLDLKSIADAPPNADLARLYNKSGLLLNISRNTTDDIFSPHQGVNHSLSIKANTFGPNDYRYSKWMFDFRTYTSAFGNVLAMRLKGGVIKPLETGGFIPVEDRFYSGGANSIRGWGRHELGPADAQNQPRGGRYLLETAVEVRTPIYKMFQSAIFWDVGNVWQDAPKKFYANLSHAVGIGLRFKTPVGPVRIDAAVPVTESSNKKIQWHLTIGEAF